MHRAALREHLTLALDGSLERSPVLAQLKAEAAKVFDPIGSYELVYTTPPRSRSLKSDIRHLRAKRRPMDYALGEILAYVVLHLLDQTLDHGRALRKCPLPDCDEPFFFSNTIGRACRPQVYCSPAHLEEGNRLNTRVRMQKQRRSAKHK